MAGFRTYNPKNVKLSLGGTPIEEGLNQGDFVSVEYNNDPFDIVVGADGFASRGANNDFSAQITLTVLQNSPANVFLENLHEGDKRSQNGSGVVPFRMSDQAAGENYQANKAWIKRKGTMARGITTNTQEWIVECADVLATRVAV